MKTITADKLKDMLIMGGETLNESMEIINSLNVFPVPDGDTGTNMNMTIQSGVKSILNVDPKSTEELLKTFSKGLLLGARGNSGVILSQFFRGFGEGWEENDEITPKTFQKALELGKKRAYASVIKAVEGTILTVIKDMANFEYKGDNFLEYFEQLLQAGEISLNNTPNLLPILKEVGVVDSGGAGFLEVFKGMLSNLSGKKVPSNLNNSFETFRQTEEHPMDINDITFGYCTEMLIELHEEIKLDEVKTFLEQRGDSIVAIEDDGILKTHVHTENPIEIFTYGQSLGDFIHIKSENMRIQAREASGEKVEVENGIVIVCSSKEMAELFSSVQKIEPIIGGQTLNPSIEDIVKAIRNTNAKNVLILPNNSNIIMAAEAAKDIIDDKNIEIIKTKFMAQGFEALINYDTELDLKENVANINEALPNLINYQVTTANKDTNIDDVVITEGQFLIMKDGKIVNCVEKEEEIFSFISQDIDIDELEVATVFIGADGKEKYIENFFKQLEEENSFIETKSFNLNQPVYQYLISFLKE